LGDARYFAGRHHEAAVGLGPFQEQVVKEDPMDATDVAQRYFDAWNRRDPEAIVATFAEGGTYTDPNIPEGLRGQAIGEYAAGLFTAFPDLSFDVISHHATGDGTVAARWLMRGTNTGSLRGNPPTGATVALPGADFIAVEGVKVRSVDGYFDRRAFVEQLGLQVIVQPYSAGPFSFGYSVRAQSGELTKPGAVGLTWIQARSGEEVGQIQKYSRAVAAEMVEMPGFIAWIGIVIANRMFTITAWEDAEALAQLRREGTHPEAMEKFFASELGSSAMTSVWKPERINTLWVRCDACGIMEDYELSNAVCQCGQPLPEPPPYW
jgi:steroid delta-isomerase-like uncharacterized protein